MIDRLGWRSARCPRGTDRTVTALSHALLVHCPQPTVPLVAQTPRLLDTVYICRGYVRQHGKAPQRRRRRPRPRPQRREPGSRMGRLGGDRLRRDEVRCLLPSSAGIHVDSTHLRSRYAEVLIDVRAHTETMVSQDCEHLYVCSRPHALSIPFTPHEATHVVWCLIETRTS